jgi:hypothetical protein
MLDRLQRQLNAVYQVSADYDIRDFLVTDPRLANFLGQGTLLNDTSETLLMSEDDDGLALSLFLDGELLQRLESADPMSRLRAHLLDDLWQVLEGVSHFNCVVWKASQDRNVSLLELELQAEIDKFIATTLIALGQGRIDLLEQLHGWLFEEISFRDGLDDEQRDRYRAANDYAARFCHALRRHLLKDAQAVLPELRRFYRLPVNDKISHIHSRSLSAR